MTDTADLAPVLNLFLSIGQLLGVHENDFFLFHFMRFYLSKAFGFGLKQLYQLRVRLPPIKNCQFILQHICRLKNIATLI